VTLDVELSATWSGTPRRQALELAESVPAGEIASSLGIDRRASAS